MSKMAQQWDEQEKKIQKMKDRLYNVAEMFTLLSQNLGLGGKELTKEDRTLMRAAVLPEVQEAAELAVARFVLGHDRDVILSGIAAAMAEADL